MKLTTAIYEARCRVSADDWNEPTVEVRTIFPKQLNATNNGNTFVPNDSPNTLWKNSTATNCPDFLISSAGTAATYATLMKKNRIVETARESPLALRTVRTGSRPLTSPRTLKALCQPTKEW